MVGPFLCLAPLYLWFEFKLFPLSLFCFVCVAKINLQNSAQDLTENRFYYEDCLVFNFGGGAILKQIIILKYGEKKICYTLHKAFKRIIGHIQTTSSLCHFFVLIDIKIYTSSSLSLCLCLSLSLCLALSLSLSIIIIYHMMFNRFAAISVHFIL